MAIWDAINNAIDRIESLLTSASNTVQEWTDETIASYHRLIARAKEFQQTFNQLKQYEGKITNPALQAEYEQVMAQGQWLSDTLNYFFNDNELGLAFPAIPVAAIAGLLAVITAWLVVAQPLLENIEKTLGAATGFASTITPLALLGGAIYFWPQIKGALK